MSHTTYLSSLDWAHIRAVTIIRLIGEPLKVVAPPDGRIVYEPILGEERALKSSIDNARSQNRDLTEDPEAIVELLGTLYAKVGILDSKGRCIASCPVSLGASVVNIIYAREGDDPSGQAKGEAV